MEILKYVLFYVGGNAIGFILGILFHRIKNLRKKTVGLLKVVKDNENEEPYIFLQITKPELLETSGNYIYLKVDQFRYEDTTK